VRPNLWRQSNPVKVFSHFWDVFGDESLGSGLFDVNAKVVESLASQSDNLKPELVVLLHRLP